MQRPSVYTMTLRKLFVVGRTRQVELVAVRRTNAYSLTRTACTIEAERWVVGSVSDTTATARPAHFVKAINGVTPKQGEFWQLLVQQRDDRGAMAWVPSRKVADRVRLNEGDRIRWRIAKTSDCGCI